MAIKKNALIIVIVLSSLILFYILSGSDLFAITPTPGAQFIKSANDPNSPYTLVMKSSNYKCDYDECIASGSMIISKNIGGINNYWSCYGQPDAVLFATEAQCQNGRKTDSIDGRPRLDRNGQQCTSQSCKQVSLPLYAGSFNFCPSTDANFAFCIGPQSSVTSALSDISYFTEEVRLPRGATVSFTPKNGDGSDITERYIRVRAYDLSCLPAIQQGTACTSGQIQCSPQLNKCQTDYTLWTYKSYGISCLNSFRGHPQKSIFSQGDEPICIKQSVAGASIYDCVEPTSDYTSYNKCESTQTIGQSTCGAFGSKLYQAPSPQQCYLLDFQGKLTTSQGKGIGGLACSGDSCALGSKIGVDGAINYKECTLVNQCNILVDKTCSQGLFFNSLTKSCELPASLSCGSPQEAKCTGPKTIEQCKAVTISGKIGYQWQTAIQCPGEFTCITKGDNLPNDYCGCIDEAYTTEIKCIDTIRYKVYSKDPNSINSCYKYRDLGNKVADNEICQNDKIVPKPGCKYNNPSCPQGNICNENLNQCEPVGCGFNTLGYECSPQKDDKGIILESCISNQCTPTQDQYTATQSDYTNLKTRCDDSIVQGVVSIQSVNRGVKQGSTTFYRWDTKTDADNSVNGLCTGNFVCINGECIPSFQYVGILAEDNYGVDILLNNIKVIVTSNVPNNRNIRVIGQLLENGVPLSSVAPVDTITDSKGETFLNFNYKHPRTGKLTIKVSVDPAGTNYQTTKEITISKRLKLLLNCPTTAFVERTVTCTWKSEDIDIGEVVSTQPVIIITQGEKQIDYVPQGISSLSFTPDKIGGVVVRVSVSKDGFISDSAETTVQIQTAQVSQSLQVDNQDYSIIGTSLETGTHQLSLTFDEAGIPAEIQSVVGVIREPSSGIEAPLTFNKVGNEWTTSYNLKQAASNYNLKYTAYFKEISREPLVAEFSLVTIGEKSEGEKSTFTGIIIALAVGLAILIILIIIIILARRKR